MSMSNAASVPVNTNNIPKASIPDNGTPVLPDSLRVYFEMRRRQVIAELNELDDLLGYARTILPKEERQRVRRAAGACNRIRQDVK